LRVSTQRLRPVAQFSSSERLIFGYAWSECISTL
jgi:hypothetical protein